MPTIISHGIAALALGKGLTGERLPLRFWVACAACAMLPDIDVVGFRFGVQYEDLLGHRGITHSLCFALLTGLAVVILLFRDTPPLSQRWIRLVVFFFLFTASHGLLDALTNGGLGVAFFAPFSNARYFFPWRPLEVSPIGLRHFSAGRAGEVILSEMIWIWIPAAVLVAIGWLLRRRARRTESSRL